MQQNVTYVEKKFLEKLTIEKNYRKFGDHCHYTGKYSGKAQ